MKEEFKKVTLNDATVYQILQSGGSLEDVVVALVKQKESLLKQNIELHAIAPKKHRAADGSILIWRCPDELVPNPV